MNTQTQKNPVVLVTGALTGIGRATALAFARQGARVVVSGRREAEGKALEAELRALGGEALFVKADVREEAQVQALVDAAVAKFGRLDVAVNNAGTEGAPAPVSAATVEDYRGSFDTNVLGTLLSMKHELRVMLPQKAGAIVNLSSIVGHVAFPGAAIYTASKHAVEGLTKAAALEAAAHGVRVNAVAPGPIDTPMMDRFTGGSAEAKAGLGGMMPAQRAGTPEEIAQTIVFLASPQASYVNGASLLVDSGYVAG